MYITPEDFDKVTMAETISAAESIVPEIDKQLLELAKSAGNTAREMAKIVTILSVLAPTTQDHIIKMYKRKGWPSVTSSVSETSTIFNFFLVV